jgi:hypothetical protein
MQHRITYRADSYQGISAAFDSVHNILLLNTNSQISVSLDNWRGAANGVQSLILSGRSLDSNQFKDLVQKIIWFG